MTTPSQQRRAAIQRAFRMKLLKLASQTDDAEVCQKLHDIIERLRKEDVADFNALLQCLMQSS